MRVDDREFPEDEGRAAGAAPLRIPAPRGNSVRVPGPVSGLANRACRLPMGYSGFQSAGVAHSGIVARPYGRLPLRGQHRNKVTTRFRQRFDFGSPSYRYYRRRVAAVLAVRVVTRTCFPLNPPGETGWGTREQRKFYRIGVGSKPGKWIGKIPGRPWVPPFRGGRRACADMSKHIQKKPLAVDLTRFLSL